MGERGLFAISLFSYLCTDRREKYVQIPIALRIERRVRS